MKKMYLVLMLASAYAHGADALDVMVSVYAQAEGDADSPLVASSSGESVQEAAQWWTHSRVHEDKGVRIETFLQASMLDRLGTDGEARYIAWQIPRALSSRLQKNMEGRIAAPQIIKRVLKDDEKLMRRRADSAFRDQWQVTRLLITVALKRSTLRVEGIANPATYVKFFPHYKITFQDKEDDETSGESGP